MFDKLKNILFAVCVVMAFTAQSNRLQEEKQHAQGHQAPAQVVHNQAPRQAIHPQVVPSQAPRQVIRRQSPPQQVQAPRRAPQQVNRRQPPPEPVKPAGFSYQGRQAPRVYAVAAPAPVENNRLFHRQHHGNWQPLYNFYDNQYHFYPYVNVASIVELSADCVAVGFDGQTYYYDRGRFYVQDPQGYLAVAPPIGIIVAVLPAHARQVNIDGQIYYRYKGVFYVQVPQGFQVVGPVQYVEGGS